MTFPLHRSVIFTPPSRNPKLVNWPPSENCNAKLNLSEAKLIISDKLQFLNDKYRILHGGSTDMDFFPSGINNVIRNERNEWVTIVCCSSWLINFWVCRALLCDVKTEATVQHFHATLAFKLFKSGKIQVINYRFFRPNLVETELPNASRCQKQCQKILICAPWSPQYRIVY